MTEAQKMYQKIVAECNAKIYGYAERIGYIAALTEIVTKHRITITDDELRQAQSLLQRLQYEVANS